MRLIINLILAAIVIGLIWILIGSIREPIAFKAEKEKREQAVINKLMDIRTAQEAFRNIKGGFAPTFDSLVDILRTDSFAIVAVIGDPDDPNFTGQITYDTSYLPAYDSIVNLGINLDSLSVIPYGNGELFQLRADTLTYQKTLVNVVEVGTKRNVFMGQFADKRFARYDNNYDPGSVLKFGDLNKPSLAGNWE